MAEQECCAWCGKMVWRCAGLLRQDAAGAKHWFHLECWREHKAWLRQWSLEAYALTEVVRG